MKVEDISSPKDIKSMSADELEELSSEIRKFLIEKISKTGGHLSSNLGVVELTIAMHYVFDSGKDRFIFDVGHQSYTHKILTGRAKQFDTLRQYKGLSGFQKREESIHDPWEAGHSSTSLSAALGFAVARDMNNDDYNVIALIGDAALASGMSFEALNQIGSEKRNIIIILNDNNMSISKNVGAFSHTLTELRSSTKYTGLKQDISNKLSNNKAGKNVLNQLKAIKDTVKEKVVDSYFFNELGIDYIGPVDGHNIKDLVRVLKSVKNHEGPICVHVITKKGKGYKYAENDISGKWHGVGKFNIETGKTLSAIPMNNLNWSTILSETLIRLAKNNEDIVAITPAMSNGSKLDKFKLLFPERFFDCGIAEEHAMTFSAALADQGKKPFISVYSSFMQRSFDQIIHDVARMNLNVVIAVDRSGLVGEDGPTHHGVFDVSCLRSVPNLIISQPKDSLEAQDLMYTAFNTPSPFLIRIPRGNTQYTIKEFKKISIGSWIMYKHSEHVDCVVITYGDDVDKVINKAKVNNINIAVVDARFFKPIDREMIDEIVEMEAPVVVYETDMLAGGLSSSILEYLNDSNQNMHITRIGIRDHFVPQGSLPQIRRLEKIDLTTLFDVITEKIDGR